MALIEKPGINARAEINPEAARKALSNDLVFGDDDALRMVVQDAEKAENYANSKAWVMAWVTANSLYQSPYSSRYWEGTQNERANVPFYTVATAVNALVPQIMNGLFYQDPPFMIQPRPKTSANATRAVGAVLAYQLDEIKFREELRLGVMNAVLFGTNIWKWGYETFTQERTEYQRKHPPASIPSTVPGAPPVQITDDDEELEEVTIEERVDRPTFEHILNVRHVLVDPGLAVPDIRKAKYVIHRVYMTFEDLDKLRDRPGYDIPSRAEILEWFLPPAETADAAIAEADLKNPQWDARSENRYEKTTIDPFNEPLEVLERWDKNRVTVVLQKKKVICNDKNPYGIVPFLSVNWWDVPEAFYGLGLAKTVGSEQRLQQGIMNAWLDEISLNLNGVYTRVQGKSQVPTQSIRVSPGKIINIENKDDFKPLDRLPAVPEAGQAIAMSESRAERTSGAGEAATQGTPGSGGHSNLARSAAGANLLAGGTGSRIQDFVEKLADQVIVPLLYNMHDLNRRLMPMSTLRRILTDELAHEYMDDPKADLLDVVNSRVTFNISAGARMQARRTMAQSLPLLAQFLESANIIAALAVEKKKPNILELTRMWFEVGDWKNYESVIEDMTDEDMQRFAQMNQMGKQQVDFQNKAKLKQIDAENKSNLIDQENIARAGREILRTATEKSAEPLEVTGNPNTSDSGFAG